MATVATLLMNFESKYRLFCEGNAFEDAIYNKLVILLRPNVLTHCGLVWRHDMATEIWVNTDSDNGLLPDGTKPLTEPILTYHKQGPNGIHLWVLS